MEYILIFIFFGAGVLLHVLQVVIDLGNQFPNEVPKGILSAFWKKDWDTLCVSAVVLTLCLAIHFVIHNYSPSIAKWEYFEMAYFGVSLVLGYSGQNLIYKFMGKASTFIENKVNEKLN